MNGGQIGHFYSGLEQDSALACMVPSGELEQDTSWGKRILPPEQIQPLGAESSAEPMPGCLAAGSWAGQEPFVLCRNCAPACGGPAREVE